jgi:transcriptional regulator with XRE-family HTH domain
MTLNNRDLIQKSFSDLINLKEEKDIIEIETHMLMYQFLSEIEKITTDRGISRKELAKLTGTSASYITQLYRGKKTINLQMLARIQRALDFKFKICVSLVEKRAEKTSPYKLIAVDTLAFKNKVVHVAACKPAFRGKPHRSEIPFKKGKNEHRAQRSL